MTHLWLNALKIGKTHTGIYACEFQNLDTTGTCLYMFVMLFMQVYQ